MKRLLGTEVRGDCIDRYWLHVGDDGRDRITVQTTQASDQIIARVKKISNEPIDRKSSFRFKASIPGTMVDDICRINASLWGMSKREVFAEMIAARTDRSQRIWRMLTEGRDFRKLQAEKRGSRYV